MISGVRRDWFGRLRRLHTGRHTTMHTMARQATVSVLASDSHTLTRIRISAPSRAMRDLSRREPRPPTKNEKNLVGITAEHLNVTMPLAKHRFDVGSGAVSKTKPYRLRRRPVKNAI
jgi:hypothetical protein